MLTSRTARARAVLDEAGYEVIFAASGKEGIERHREWAPDCVFAKSANAGCMDS